MADDVTIRIATEVRGAITEIRKLSEEFVKFRNNYLKVANDVNKTFFRLGGQDLIKQAQTLSQVVDKIGGITKLTASETKALHKVLTEVVEKYNALGKAVPAQIRAVYEETQRWTQAQKASADAAKLAAEAQKKAAAEAAKEQAALRGVMGDNLTRQVQAYAAALEKVGGITKLTNNEKAKLLKTLTELSEKYAAIGRTVPANIEKIYQETKKLDEENKKGAAAIKAIQDAYRRAHLEQQKMLAESAKIRSIFSGGNAIREAQRYAEAIRSVGGVTKLTVAEQAKANRVIQEAIDKYKAMGQKVPADLQRIADATRQVTTQSSTFFNSFFSRIAGGTAAGYLLADGMIRAFGMIRDAAVRTFTEIFKLIEKGSKFQQIENAFGRLTESLGLSGDQLIRLTQERTQGLIDRFNIMQSANRAMLFGLQLTEQQFADLTQASIVLGRAMSVGPEQSLERLILALGRVSPRILDDLGIIVKVTDATKKWADAHNKTVEQMSGEERVLAFQEAALKKINEFVRSLGDVYLTLQDRIQQVKVKWTDWYNELARTVSLSPVLNQMFTSLLDILNRAFGANNQGLIKEITSLIELLAIRVVELSARIIQLGINVVKSYGVMNIQVTGFTKGIVDSINFIVMGMQKLANMALAMPGAKFIPQVQDMVIAANFAALEMGKLAGTVTDKWKTAWDTFKGDTQALKAMEQLQKELEETAKRMNMIREGKILPFSARPAPPLPDALKNLLKLGDGTDDLTEQYDAAGKVTESFEKRMARLNFQLDQAYKNGVKNEDIVKRWGSQIKNLAIEAEALGEDLPKAFERAFNAVKSADLGKAIQEALKKANTFAREEGERINKEQQDRLRETGIDNMQLWLENSAIQMQAMDDAINAQTRSEEAGLEERLQLVKNDYAKRRAMVKKEASNYKKTMDDLSKAEAAELKEVRVKFAEEMANMKAEMGPFQDAFLEIFQSIPQMIGKAILSGEGMGTAFRALGGKIGSEIFGAIFKSRAVSNTISQGMAKLFGVDFAAKFAQFLGPIGGVIGEVVGNLITKVFDKLHKTLEEKISEDVLRDYGVKISENLAKAIAEDAKRIGSRQAATLLHLSEIINEAGGITYANASKWTRKTRDLFSMLEIGKLTEEEVVGELEKIFPQLVGAIDAKTGLASEGLVELVELTKRFGLEVKAVTEYIEQNTNRVLKGFNAIAVGITFDWFGTEGAEGAAEDVSELTDRAEELKDIIAELEGKEFLSGNQKVALREARQELAEIEKKLEDIKNKAKEAAGDVAGSGTQTQEEFTRATRLASLAYRAAVANGMPVLQIIEQMGEGLDALIKAQETFGFESSGAFKDLAAIRAFVKEHSQLAGVIGGINDMAVGLYNTNQLNQEGFNDLQATAGDTFKRIMAEGLTAEQAMRLMQPTLQTLFELQQRGKFAVDEATQALIDQAKAAGIVGDEFKSNETKMVDATEKVAEILERMALAMGVSLEGISDKVNDSLIRTHEEGVQPLTEGVDENKNTFVDWGYQAVDQIDGVTDGVVTLTNKIYTLQEAIEQAKAGFHVFGPQSVPPLQDVQTEVDAVSYGHSPGGLVDIIAKAAGATTAIKEFTEDSAQRLRDLFYEVDFPKLEQGWFGGGSPKMPRIISQEEYEELIRKIGLGDIPEIPRDLPPYADPLPDWPDWDPGKIGPWNPDHCCSGTTINIEQGAFKFETLGITDAERIEQQVTNAMIRVVATNPNGEYSKVQVLVRDMVSGH